jgi:hypothetical protein
MTRSSQITAGGRSCRQSAAVRAGSPEAWRGAGSIESRLRMMRFRVRLRGWIRQRRPRTIVGLRSWPDRSDRHIGGFQSFVLVASIVSHAILQGTAEFRIQQMGFKSPKHCRGAWTFARIRD